MKTDVTESSSAKNCIGWDWLVSSVMQLNLGLEAPVKICTRFKLVSNSESWPTLLVSHPSCTVSSFKSFEMLDNTDVLLDHNSCPLSIMKALYLGRFNVPGSKPDSLWKVCLQHVWWLNSSVLLGLKFLLHESGIYSFWAVMFCSVREVYLHFRGSCCYHVTCQ